MPRDRRRRQPSLDIPIGILLGVLGLALICGLGVAWYWAKLRHVPIDEANNCPRKGPTAIHAILIDRSDPIPPQQVQRVRQEIDRHIANARAGERFDLYVADSDSFSVLTPLASVCSPGRPDDANPLYENPDRIRRQFEEKFVRPLRQGLDSLLAPARMETSPILEGIRAAAATAFGAVEAGSIPLQMTIVSDFVQNSPLNSHFRGEVNFDELARKPAWRSLQANLKGAKVHLLYLLRADAVSRNQPIQNRGHQAFWEKAIRQSGGELSLLTTI
jgi:hypothetical protein